MERYTKVYSLYPQIKRALSATYLNEIFTWVDASYAIHHGMRNHTEVEM